METDYLAAGILISCYKALGDQDGARRAAKRALERAEKIATLEPDNGSAMGYAVGALAALGESERAKERAQRALLLDPLIGLVELVHAELSGEIHRNALLQPRD